MTVVAEQWFESIVWDEGGFCPHCGSLDTKERKIEQAHALLVPRLPGVFSVRTETSMHRSKSKWTRSTMDGLEKNKHESKKLHIGTGGIGKTAVVGVKHRASGNVPCRSRIFGQQGNAPRHRGKADRGRLQRSTPTSFPRTATIPSATTRRLPTTSANTSRVSHRGSFCAACPDS